MRYVGHRLQRMAGSPHRLALGVAAGVFVATLPVPGAQMLLAVLLAWAIGGNVPAALLGTFWANPVTLPVLWVASHWLGALLLAGITQPSADVLAQLAALGDIMTGPGRRSLAAIQAAVWPVLKPLALGALIIGAVSAAAFYGLTIRLVAGYRRERLGSIGHVDQPQVAALPLGVSPAA